MRVFRYLYQPTAILAAGAPYYSYGYLNKNMGETQIYTRSGTTWTQQATLSQNQVNSEEGSAVSLSADGNTLAAGAPGTGTGATNVYVRLGTAWSLQASLAVDVADSSQGVSVALSANGNTLAVGATRFNGTGASQIYTRSGTSWQYEATLSQNIASSYEGNAVALSADGNTLAVGACSLNSSSGATQVYTRSGTTWTYQATLSQRIAASYEGNSVSLSADGTTLAAGAYQFGLGVTQIYVWSGNAWTLQASLSQKSVFYEGYSVSLSADGNTLAAAAPDLPFFATGAAQIYTRSGTTWTHQVTLSPVGVGVDFSSVSLSADNTTLAVGGSNQWTIVEGATALYVN